MAAASFNPPPIGEAPQSVTGAWKRSVAVQAGPQIWGTGINPIHAVRMGNGRGLAEEGSANLVSEALTGPYEQDPTTAYGFTSEDYHLINGFGYDTDTGTADRPPVGTNENRAHSDDFPAYTDTGEMIRAEDKGSLRTTYALVIPEDDAAQGWTNKSHGEEGYAKPSDPSQYEMTTSMRQRFETRAGSQVPDGGRASKYDQPIHSRTVGQKLRNWVGDYSIRHADMQRASQQVSIRGFWNRGAGTGPVEWVGDAGNMDYINSPYQRVVPQDPYVGPEIGTSQVTDQIDSENWYY